MASRIFSLTCVMVSQFNTFTGISGLFSLSGLTQFRIYKWPEKGSRRELREKLREKLRERK